MHICTGCSFFVSGSYQKLWVKNNKQDEIIQNHEIRIARLEAWG